jgi:lipoprotein-anchoring transpeptidase ErfK/SrfK
MLNRRDFMVSAIAFGSLGVLPAMAQRASDYVLPQEYLPKPVRLPTPVEPGEIHVDPISYKLYWTLPGGQAVQYTVGVGRDNLYEAGTFFIGAKKEWPSWTPTRDMIARQPELYAQWAGGMPGGPNNPLGARALYLFTRERGDTFLRIHGTNDPGTIGMAVSNGCTRLVNDHAIDLYDRVPLGSRVVLHPKSGSSWTTAVNAGDAHVEPFGSDIPNTPAVASEPSEGDRMCIDVLRRAVRCSPY